MKYIFSDLDNTLLFGGKIKEKDLEAIRKWKTLGHKFVIATGRGKNMMDIIFDNYSDLADYYILNNGALLLDKNKNKISGNIMDFDTVKDVVKTLGEKDVLVALETENEIYSIGEFKDEICPEVGETTINLSQDQVVNEKRDIIFLNCSPKTKKIEDSILIYDELYSKYSEKISIFRNKHWIDMIPKNLSKGQGIKNLINLECLEPKDIFVIGDSLNDISMFEDFKNSYTFVYAEDIVKDKCKCIVEDFGQMVEDIL